ncbi:MAG TPA: hypothetical protein VMG98_16120 [Verrucomicrobiae bacterium]|nr:hypothetical protein [Verrucomicrobiae bacterium]
MLPLLLVVMVAQVTPLPSAPPLKTIVTVKSSPLCQALTSTAFDAISGLQSNDRIVEATKPVLVDFGKAWVDNSVAGHQFDQMQIHQNLAPADVHNDQNPALILPARKLARLAEAIVHNLQVIDALLADPRLTPVLKSQLQAVADQQRHTLNVIYGLADTFELQDLIAHGDNTQGVLNVGFQNKSGGHQLASSFNDQDVSFQDVVSGPQRAVALFSGTRDPTVDTDPAISQKATGELANNPIFRFYQGIQQNQLATAHAEDQLDQTVLQMVNECKP